MKRKKASKMMTSWWFVLVMFLIAFFMVFVYFRAFYQDYKVEKEIESLQAEIKRLDSKKIETLEILNYVKSDDFVEEKARTELNMVRPGEKMLVVKKEEKNAPRQEKEDVIEFNRFSNLEKWFNYFFK